MTGIIQHKYSGHTPTCSLSLHLHHFLQILSGCIVRDQFGDGRLYMNSMALRTPSKFSGSSQFRKLHLHLPVCPTGDYQGKKQVKLLLYNWTVGEVVAREAIFLYQQHLEIKRSFTGKHNIRPEEANIICSFKTPEISENWMNSKDRHKFRIRDISYKENHTKCCFPGLASTNLLLGC